MGTVRAYVALTKPRIIEVLLVTTVPTMILAADGWPPVGTALATLLGGTLAAAGANTFNSYLDRDIDRVMSRTKHRPLVTGAVSPRAALIFGWVLSIVSVAFMAATTNLLAAGLTALSIVLYVVVYTMLLKRRTAQNIVWGGAAGCMPVLISWAAVTGGLAWPAGVLFAVIFMWTPPHYWPLSLRFSADYAAARVPMLPVVAEQRRVANQIVAYSWGMVAASLLLVPVAGTGPVYAVAASLAAGDPAGASVASSLLSQATTAKAKTRAARVPLRRSPVEMPKGACIQASMPWSTQAKGIRTPMAITVPGTA